MSDHKASAQEWLGMADEHGDWILDRPKKTVERYLAAAQVEATLYLAEQQRIANLLAYAQFRWTAPESGHSIGIEPDWASRILNDAAEGLALI